MFIADRHFIQNAPVGTAFTVVDEKCEYIVGSCPMFIFKHIETKDGKAHLGGLLSLEPWPNVDGKFKNGPASFEGLDTIRETDFGENTKFLIFETDDIVKMMQAFMFSLSGRPEVLAGLPVENQEDKK